MSDADARAVLARRLRTQQIACRELGSPLYDHLLGHAVDDLEAGGVLWRVLEGHEGDPGPSVIALRLLGAIHRIVLTGRAPALAAYYPSAGADPRAGWRGLWEAFRDTIEEHLPEIRAELERGVQTNEVGRAGALVGGFLLVAAETSMPLRVLEVGASAGLNLRWDHFSYGAGERRWGPADSPVQLGDPYVEGTPPFDVEAIVAERRGCDPHPLDPSTDEGRITLMSYAWPDMTLRYQHLRGALDIARAVPVTLDQSEAAPWVTAQLAEPRPGVATVVYHSVVMQYLDDAGRTAFRAALDDAAARATREAPLAWLRFEPARRTFEVTLTTWPGGRERLIAESGAHGRPVRWFGE